jgi:high-affinity Fe2+/Pb2+ permease
VKESLVNICLSLFGYVVYESNEARKEPAQQINAGGRASSVTRRFLPVVAVMTFLAQQDATLH